MIKSRCLITATTVAAAFFLVCLGMRLSCFDKSPKPRPRAVLNPGKSVSGHISSIKLVDAKSVQILHETHAVHFPFTNAVGINSPQLAEPVVTNDARLPKDRSPPRC